MTRPEPKRLTVFTGSRLGARPVYREQARAFGEELARRSVDLVYGGGAVGLMGVLADSVLRAGGRVIGVIPHWLIEKEIAHAGLTETHTVSGMHERKALMATLSDAFVAMPGGFGTFDELFEVLTWSQIGLHHKPIGLFDVEGYFGPFMGLVEHAAREGFVVEGDERLLIRSSDPSELLDQLLAFRRPELGSKWLDAKKT